MSGWDEQLASTRADYLDRLEQLGFRRTEPQTVDGTLDMSAGSKKITIAVGERFPFFPPSIRVRDSDLTRSWHLDPDDFLCLYTRDDHNAAPWQDPTALLGRISEWFNEAAAGWPDDVPVLDAERYLHSDSSEALLLYDDLTPFLGRYARLRQGPNGLLTLERTNPPPVRARRGERRKFARVVDVGSLEYPPRDWDDLLEIIPDADVVEREVRAYRISALVLVYSRAGHSGVLAAHVFPLKDGSVAATAYRSASAHKHTTQYRSGIHRRDLEPKRVLVVGVGAVGSFLSDMLARDGVGHLTLRDGELLHPGNIVRHLCGVDAVGLKKVFAIERMLSDRSCVVSCEPTSLVDPSELPTLFEAHDLVIDATADGAVTRMLGQAAETFGRHILSVCVQNDGDTTRVDVIPPISGDPLPPSPQRTSAAPAFFEGGCGDPISPTPPHAVIDAAALAARHAVGLLVSRTIHGAGELRDTPNS